jgi:hypothetical protein
MILTFQDAVERLIDYLGAQASDTVLRDAKQACIEALRDLVQAHPWTYLYATGRINLTPSYDDGLVTYLASSGAYPNQVTISGGTWPDWAALGVLRIANYNYDVLKLINGTTLQLVASTAPPSDIATPTEFGLFQDSYTLPDDFAEIDQAFIPLTWGNVNYCHPRQWLWEISRWGLIGNPVVFTVMADPDQGGKLCMRFAPFPVLPYPVEFLYKRHSKPLTVFKACQGTITTASSSTTVVGTGTAFTKQMVGGCVLRISGTSKPPTAQFGDNPAIFESKITGYTSATQIETLDAVPDAYTNAPYTVSSYVDIETGAMEQAYLRCCEMHIAISRIMKDKPSAKQQYLTALEVAKCADSRSMKPRVAGEPSAVRWRLKDYPINLGSEA